MVDYQACQTQKDESDDPPEQEYERDLHTQSHAHRAWLEYSAVLKEKYMPW